ncbi:MAG: 4a-hydroxytetrahydrobiopterin dehydratase [Bdellovibrionales bacterium]
MNTALDDTVVAAALQTLPGWGVENNALVKTFVFMDFKAALAFMNAVGGQADKMNHHPEWTNVYNKVAVQLRTHDAGNKITENDLRLAEIMEKEALAFSR